MEEGRSDLKLSKLSRLDLKANPTQLALEVKDEVEDYIGITLLVSQA
jgi:hypothetical protein